ncbi:MAG: YdeI/OmpD-associated family protein [Opitutaceae bacterium]|jgi:uncharacterized protein YdeI (YjbR/CyaY-like superfamily)
MKDDQLVFKNRAAFRKWLAKNHRNCPGIWLVFGKDCKLRTLTAHEALEEALCFGWIDGQLQSLGAEKYLKKFTPRRKGSVWSERNRELAQKLIADGTMTAAGQAAIAQAQKMGTWDRPKPTPILEAQVGILTEALSGTGQALTNFLNMSLSVRRTYTGFYLSAKMEDTRKKRLERIIERLKENKKPM